MSRLDTVLLDIQTQKNKSIRKVQEAYVDKFGADNYTDLLCFAILNNDNAFAEKSIEKSYIKLTQTAIKNNKRISPEEITQRVFNVPEEAIE